MAKNKPSRTPKYRKQKRPNSADAAFVELNGTRYYLGRYGSDASWLRYHQILAEWKAHSRQGQVHQDQITVVELIARFWRHAQSYYSDPDGRPTKEQMNFRITLSRLKNLYGPVAAIDFGPRALKALRQHW